MTEIVEPQMEIVENQLEVKDVLPKYKETNPRNYNEEQLARKRLETKDLMKHYPDMSPAWIEMVWDYVENTPKERIDEIIRTKEFETKPQKKRQSKGGKIFNAISVRTRTEEELKDREFPMNDFEKVTGRVNPLPEPKDLDLSGN